MFNEVVLCGVKAFVWVQRHRMTFAWVNLKLIAYQRFIVLWVFVWNLNTWWSWRSIKCELSFLINSVLWRKSTAKISCWLLQMFIFSVICDQQQLLRRWSQSLTPLKPIQPQTVPQKYFSFDASGTTSLDASREPKLPIVFASFDLKRGQKNQISFRRNFGEGNNEGVEVGLRGNWGNKAGPKMRKEKSLLAYLLTEKIDGAVMYRMFVVWWDFMRLATKSY